MSWKENAVALYKRFGAPGKFAAKMIVGSLPYGSVAVDLVGQMLDCVHETVKDQIEIEEAMLPPATAEDLKRVEDILGVLIGDLSELTAKVAAKANQPAEAAQVLKLARAADEPCKAALHKLDQLARGIEGLHDKADQMMAKLDELLRRNHVPLGSQPEHNVSISDEKEKAFLLWMRAEYRSLPPDGRRIVDLGKLGDALRAAGLPGEAKEVYAEAAAKTTESRQALSVDREAFLLAVQEYTSVTARDKYARVLDDLISWTENQGGAAQFRPRGDRDQATVTYCLAGGNTTFWTAYPRKKDGAKLSVLDSPSRRVPEEVREALRQEFARLEDPTSSLPNSCPTLSFSALATEMACNELYRCLSRALAALGQLRR